MLVKHNDHFGRLTATSFKMMNKDQQELTVLAAWLYYDDELTHEQIGHRLGISRIMVTRLLQKARREGIVQIKITKPLPIQHDLEHRLQTTFGLKHAIVVRTRSTADATLGDVGRAGADYLKRIVYSGCRLGVGWSTTVSRMALHLEAPPEPVTCAVNDLAGSYLGHANPYSISVQVAKVLGAPLEALPIPAVMQEPEARDAVLKEQPISIALEHASRSDIAIVGLGDVGDHSTLVHTGYLTPEQMADVRRHGAVGDVLLHFYDIHGRYVPTPLDARTISVNWEQLQHIPYVVALATGPTKLDAILGALRGGLCHCLITDTETARCVLEHNTAA
jgi:DNA-binding transcriptional regulator LsrR (DeoR family)